MRQTMRRCLVLAGGLLLLGCRSEPADEVAEVPADSVAASPAILLEDIAGTWDVRYVPQSGDTTVTSSQIRVTANGWTLLLADREPIVGAVMTSGDSIIAWKGRTRAFVETGSWLRPTASTGWKGTGWWAPWWPATPRADRIRCWSSVARGSGLLERRHRLAAHTRPGSVDVDAGHGPREFPYRNLPEAHPGDGRRNERGGVPRGVRGRDQGDDRARRPGLERSSEDPGKADAVFRKPVAEMERS